MKKLIKPSEHSFKIRLRKAEKHLISKEVGWESVIKRYGKCQLAPSKREPIEYLIRSIISQQLSSKAAATIVGRVEKQLGRKKFSAKNILAIPHSELRASGLSNAKASYSHSIAEAVVTKSINFKNLYLMDTEQAFDALVQLKGVGRWTAQMFCIFALGHLDVMAYDDVGLQRGMQRMYQLDSKPDKTLMEQISKQWSPYRSVACWYLWRIADDS